MNWVRFLWSYISYRKDLLVALFLCALVMTAAELSVPWLIKEAVDAILGATAEMNLDRWLLLTMSILAALYIGHVLLLRIAAQLMLHCSYNLRRRLYAHIHAQTLPFFERHRTGELVHRVTSDTRILEDETGRILHDVPGELVTVVGVTILMVLLHPGLAMLVIGFMVVAAAVAGYLGVPLPGLRRSAQRIAAHLTARLQETLAGVRAVQATRAVGGRLQELLDDHERLQPHGWKRLSGEAWPITVDGISFRHATSERDVLRDVSFTVAPGEAVAIAGRNGAGKSTLLDLLLRFYDPTAGRIVVGSVDLRECDLDSWRQAVGIMGQDVFLFHGTIAENIAYGRPEATPEEIDQAVRDAGLDRLMQRFPMGLETVVGERGTQLSGGERQ